MIQIKFSEIKEFFARTRHIKTATLVPVYGYFKLECKNGAMTLSKANGHSFVIHEIEGTSEGDAVVLIEEKSLSIMCDKPGADTLTISRDGNRVLLSDGKYKQSFVEEDIKLFPTFPKISSKNEHHLNGEVLQAIYAASKYVGEKVIDQFAFVYTIGNCVYASDRFVLYSKKFDIDLPSLTLSNTCCDALAGFSDIIVVELTKHLVFKTGKSILGFTKFDYNAPAFEKLLSTMIMGNTCSLPKIDVIDYCDRVVKMSSGANDNFTIEDIEPGILTLNYESPELAVSNVVNISAQFEPGFGFKKPFLGSAAQFRRLFSPMPNDTVKISLWGNEHRDGLLFTSEENQLSFISGMVTPPTK
jgi:hypothetical protein